MKLGLQPQLLNQTFKDKVLLTSKIYNSTDDTMFNQIFKQLEE